jgi:hypothetical protein
MGVFKNPNFGQICLFYFPYLSEITSQMYMKYVPNLDNPYTLKIYWFSK